MAMHVPFLCPRGHDLGPGQVLVGWTPCVCSQALQHYRGHRTYRCIACEADGVTMVCYLPYHAR